MMRLRPEKQKSVSKGMGASHFIKDEVKGVTFVLVQFIGPVQLCGILSPKNGQSVWDWTGFV